MRFLNKENVAMKARQPAAISVAEAWELARSGDLRRAAEAARRGLASPGVKPSREVELRLVLASCQMRQGLHADALCELDAAARSAALPGVVPQAAMRVEAWRAELAYFQGRYSAAEEAIGRLLPQLTRRRDWAYAAFVLRIRIAILLARAEYDAIEDLAQTALRHADASGDPYVIVQVLNILGAARFDRATSKLPQPHARSHLSALDPDDAAPMESDAREALRFFERAREVAEQGGYEFAAWYVAGNIERLQILLGHAATAVRAIRKRLEVLQAKGAKYDEIVTRSNLAWALRLLGRHEEALHELDVALNLARDTGTFNVLLEFLHYDRSIVLEALGDHAGARASYRRYARLVGKSGSAPRVAGVAGSGPAKRPLEPHFLKRADRFIVEQIGTTISVARLAEHCGVSWRTLQKAFMDFRGVTPVAHSRNLRLDYAHRALSESGAPVAEVAARFGFRSPTTFSLEYRRRFGLPPSRAKRARL
jgi:AraC-like DNA-binding protein